MNTRIITASVLAAASFAGVASADSVNMYFVGTGQGSNVHVSFFGSGADVFAGQLRHNITSATGQATSLLGERRTFCADFEQHVATSSSTFEVVATRDLLVRNVPLGTPKASALSSIYAAYGNTAIGSGASTDFGAAFQLAVWEILYDYNAGVGVSSINLSSGNIQFSRYGGGALSSGIVNQFNTIISAIGNGGSTSNLFALQNGSRQDQLVFGNNLIPSPGSAVMAALGGLAMTRRRRTTAR